MKNIDFINKKELEKIISRTIDNSIEVNEQREQLESYGFVFRSIDTFVDFKSEKEYEVSIKFTKPAFTKRMLSRYDLKNLEFDYDNEAMKIEIFNIVHNEFITDKKKLEKQITKDQEKLEDYTNIANNPMLEDVPIPKMGNRNIEDMVEEQFEKNKYELDRVKKEIENTINASLELMRQDILKINSEIRKVVENYKDNLENKKSSFKNFLNNHLNKRAMNSVKHNLKLNYKKHLLEKKIKVQQVNEKIAGISYTKNLLQLGQKIAEKQMYLNKKASLKQDYLYLKKSKNVIFANIEEIVEEKNREYTLELIGEVKNAEDINISEFQLLKYCIPPYNKMIGAYML
jgi:hypothetical protein